MSSRNDGSLTKIIFFLLLFGALPAASPMLLSWYLETYYTKPCIAAGGHFTLAGCLKPTAFQPYRS